MQDSRRPDRPTDRTSRRRRRTRLRRGRRRWLKALLGTGVAGLGAAGYAFGVEPYWVDVQRVAMVLPDAHPDLAGLKILQISDLHAASTGAVRHLRRQISVINTLAPDVIVITGDFVTAGDTLLLDDLAFIVGQLRAPLGIFGVLGNHDYDDSALRISPRIRYAGIVADRITAALAPAGLTMLRNTSTRIVHGGGRLQLVGLEDWMCGVQDLDAAYGQTDAALPTVVLAHNPDAAPGLADRRADWILAGHTHGGQVRLPLYGPLYAPIRTSYYAGRYALGRQTLYVNRGLGWLMMPVRFWCRPEITLFTVTAQT